jgi:hypothetical protein
LRWIDEIEKGPGEAKEISSLAGEHQLDYDAWRPCTNRKKLWKSFLDTFISKIVIAIFNPRFSNFRF